MKRIPFLWALILGFFLATAFAPVAPVLGKSVNSKGTRSGGGGGDFPNITAPSGSASFTVEWEAEAGADGYLVYVSTATQTFADETLYAYRYKATGQATESLVISGVAAGTYYVRVAPYIGTAVLLLSFEATKTAS